MGINKPISLDGQTVNVDLSGVNAKLDTLLENKGTKTFKTFKKNQSINGSGYVSFFNETFTKPFTIENILIKAGTNSVRYQVYVDGNLITRATDVTIPTETGRLIPFHDAYVFQATNDTASAYPLNIVVQSSLEIKLAANSGTKPYLFISGYEE